MGVLLWGWQSPAGRGLTKIKRDGFRIRVAGERGSESPSPSCLIEAAQSASGVVCRGQTKSRQDFSGSGIWEEPSGTDGA
jgi:hypothetical protein